MRPGSTTYYDKWAVEFSTLFLLTVLCVGGLLVGCGEAADDSKKPPPPIVVEETPIPTTPSPVDSTPTPPVQNTPGEVVVPVRHEGTWPIIYGAAEVVDRAMTIARDSEGSLYIAGKTETDFVTGKAASDGYRRAFVAKFNYLGEWVWGKKIIATTGRMFFYSTAIDSKKNIYVVGDIDGVSEAVTRRFGLMDVILVKLDREGNQLWIKQIGTDRQDGAHTVLVDDNDNIYVVGNSDAGLFGPGTRSEGDYWLAKYDSDGRELWGMQVDSSDSKSDTSLGAAQDAAGNIYITGKTTGLLAGDASFGQADIFIAKYDKDGTELWIRQIGSNMTDWGSAISVNAVGYSCITGYSSGDLFNINAGGEDVIVLRYNASGESLDTMQFGTAENERGMAVVLDKSDLRSCYVAGTTSGALAGNSLGMEDIFLSKLAMGTNKITWTRQMGTPGDDDVEGLIMEPSGGYLAGEITEVNNPAGVPASRDIFVELLLP